MTALDTDVAVIGSGFGGSVAALRAAEKGYRVTVLEQGARVGAAEVDAAERDVRRLVWAPALGMRGYLSTRVLPDVAVLGGVGWGGGSLVYGAVLLEPPAATFAQPAWQRTGVAWQAELAPHYATAARMLGRATVPALGAMDDYLARAAAAVGAAASFGPTPVGIHFGAPGVTTPDPYFGGDGPPRTGCTSCGRCLAGCPIGAKGSLDLTYLHLAERRGARARTGHRAVRIAPRPGGGYQVDCVDPRTGRAHPPLTAVRVVVAAGVLGTIDLLLRCRDVHGTLPRLSARLGRGVHTNGEAIVGVEHAAPPDDLVRGVAISSHFHPDATTHVTQNRLPAAHGLLRLAATPLARGRRAPAPVAALRRWLRRDWWRRVTVLTAMQTWSGQLTLELARPWWAARRPVLTSRSDGARPPARFDAADRVARALADAAGGAPFELLPARLGRAVTAHILGGCAIGASVADGVVDAGHEAFGHPGLYVVDGSATPGDVGVNPSLTITAMAERCLARWPASPGS